MPVGKDNKLLVFGISFLFIILLGNIDFRMKKELWYLVLWISFVFIIL